MPCGCTGYSTYGRPPEAHVEPSGRTPLTSSGGDTTYPISPIQVTAREKAMNAPPKIDPVTAHSDGDVVHWLTNDTRDERFIDNIFAFRNPLAVFFENH